MGEYLKRINYDTANDAVGQAQWTEKKWVWIYDKEKGFYAAQTLSENGDKVEVLLEDNITKKIFNINDTEKMNPPKFDRIEDMAGLTHLNEASVAFNLKARYMTNLIYTYSGLFCVTINPYKKLPIYSDDIIKAYKGKKREEMPPHIYAVVDQAYTDMLTSRENQSILITGESGAGKTENTKKVIQYLAASSNSGKMGTLEQQILQANPILEAFGNAQTIRNNNSSRFGKFIRIEFGSSGLIVGANIERYLLEKSRVTHQTNKERNYHIFYQLLKGGDSSLKQTLLLDGSASDYRFTKNSNKNIDGVDDAVDFKIICESLAVMNFNDTQRLDFFRIIAAILHLGNLTLDADKEDQASLTAQSNSVAEKVCHVLGIQMAEFSRALCKPKIKAGRDWVTQARNVEQVYYSIEALSRSLYERMFGDLIDKLNATLYTTAQKQCFIGVLDIAGFEIFEKNSFEQLCINYTNERLQQFFNHHMFVLEQEEYKREGVEWKFIDFGLDLLPTIELIEKTSPIGILSLLDEECVMPRATDKTFIDKLNQLWKGKSSKYDTPRFNAGFILTHYAGKVEYTVNGWLDKNKDPLNENVTKLLANSSDKYVASLFADSFGDDDPFASQQSKTVIKKGVFRTVSQKHKESLTSLMNQLYSTHPHFVRCIIPNEEKKAGKIDINLVLDQLRCNGVLEGIRICRAGFPNRLIFQDFISRYRVLTVGFIPKGYIDGKKASTLMLDYLQLDKNLYRIGASKVFFKAGVLAGLENMRDVNLGKMVTKIQAHFRGYLTRKLYTRKTSQAAAIKIIQKNARIYVVLREWSWWKLFSKLKPLLKISRLDEDLKAGEALAKEWEAKAKKELEEKAKIEALKMALDLENGRIQALLLSEQRTSADQAAILARTQKREVELNDRISEALHDLEALETLNNNLNDSKKKLEGEISNLRDQGKSDSATIDRLEREKLAKEQKLKSLEAELATEVARIQKLEADKKVIDSQLLATQSELGNASISQNDLSKQKAKLQAQLNELESKLESEIADRKQVESKRNLLEQELFQNRETIALLEIAKVDLKKREQEVALLNQNLSNLISEKEAVEKQSRDLTVKLQSSQDEFANEKLEREKLSKQKKKVDDEIISLRNLMQEKGTEGSKMGELLKLRDQEGINLKSQMNSVQLELEETRRRGLSISEKFNSQVGDLKQEILTLQKTSKILEVQIKEITAENDKLDDNLSKATRSKTQTEIGLESIKATMAQLEVQLLDSKSQKELVEKQLASANSLSDQYQSDAARLEKEKSAFQKSSENFHYELESEISKRSSLEGQKKKLSVEIADLQAHLEEEIAAKNEAVSKLAVKTSELDAIKEKYARDVTTRTAELEEAKKKVERDLIDVNAKLEESIRNASNLDRTRTRLAGEIEDLKLEIDREHNTSRNAERILKQVEAKFSEASLIIEDERRQKDFAESNARKLQATLDSFQAISDDKSNQILSLQKSKNDLDAELKSLINEIGEGGKNLHELEKSKRKLESQIDELTLELETAVNAKNKAEDSKKTIDSQFADFRKKAEEDLNAKDQVMEETRKMLMKEVNSLGEQLDEALNSKNEALKLKKKLEEQVQDINSRFENTSKGQTDLQKLKSKNETLIKELEAKLSEEHKSRMQIEELCVRHEKKANVLQSEIEKLELQIEVVERAKKQLNQKVEELDQELNSGDDSKKNLLETRRKLINEVEIMKQKLSESEEARTILENAKPSVTEAPGRAATLLEYEEKISNLEDSRRALLAAQRLANQEADDKIALLASTEKARKQLQSDLEDVKSRLESEMLSKNEENNFRRKLEQDSRTIQQRLDAETMKCAELNDALTLYKARADQAAEKLEAAELGRLRAEKNESLLKITANELHDSLDTAVKQNSSTEMQLKATEDRIQDLQDKIEDNAHELSDLTIAKKKLQEAQALLVERHKGDLDERELLEDQTRKKYQKEIKTLIAEIEQEKLSGISLKEAVRDLEIEVESLTIKLDTELRSSIGWKKEKETLELRLEDIAKTNSHLLFKTDDQANSIAGLNKSLREMKIVLDSKEYLIQQFETLKRSFEEKITSLEAINSSTSKDKTEMNKNVLNLDATAGNLRESLESAQRELLDSDDRVRKAESHAHEIRSELTKEKSLNIELEKAKVALEKSLKELNGRVFELEGLQINRDTNTTRRLENRVEELNAQLENEMKAKSDSLKECRKLERSVRELQFQVTEKDKIRSKFEDESEKQDQKYKKLKSQLDELELSENNLQLAKRKAEREASEFRERALKYEKEVDTLRKRGTA